MRRKMTKKSAKTRPETYHNNELKYSKREFFR